MPRYWIDVRVEARATGQLDDARIAQHHRQLLTQMRTPRLAEIREASGLNQTDVANRIGVSRSLISRIERGDIDRAEIATVRAYVGALGGEVEIVAKFGNERFTIG
jgi:DNA-binding XRE family transcriptional regulator